MQLKLTRTAPGRKKSINYNINGKTKKEAAAAIFSQIEAAAFKKYGLALTELTENSNNYIIDVKPALIFYKPEQYKITFIE